MHVRSNWRGSFKLFYRRFLTGQPTQKKDKPMLQNKTIIPFAIITLFTLSVFPFSSVFAQGKMFLQKNPDFNVDLQQPSKGVVLDKIPKKQLKNSCVRALNDFFLWHDDVAGILESNYQETHALDTFGAAVTSINSGSIIIAQELQRLRDLNFHPGDVLYFQFSEAYQKVQEAHQSIMSLDKLLRSERTWWWPNAPIHPDVADEIGCNMQPVRVRDTTLCRLRQLASVNRTLSQERADLLIRLGDIKKSLLSCTRVNASSEQRRRGQHTSTRDFWLDLPPSPTEMGSPTP